MMNGKVCLVTGATSGIGKEIALGLVRRGAAVVLVGRDRSKCESTLNEIKQRAGGNNSNNNDDNDHDHSNDNTTTAAATNTTTKNNNSSTSSSALSDDGNDNNNYYSRRISYLVADLSSQASIRNLAKQFLAKYQSLHVLVNNAGVFLAKRMLTVDGIEYTFALNHLAPFLLTNLLLDKLKASSSQSASSRIITTSSVAHRGATIDFDDIQFERKPYNGMSAYGQSKLANILFTYELARRLEGTGVTANCFHPGGIRTNLVAQENPWYYRAMWTIIAPFLASPETGADTGIYLASSPEVEGVSGKYFVKRKQTKSSAVSYDQEVAAKLWKLSEELTNF